MRKDEGLRKYWDGLERERASEIERILSQARSEGATFNNVSQAANYAAKSLSRVHSDQRPVNRSTLTRNDVYRQVLVRFVKDGGGNTLKTSERMKLELQLRDQRKRADDLEKQLMAALENRSMIEHKLTNSVTHNASNKAVQEGFRRWKNVIDRLLSEIPDSKINLQLRTVEDPLGKGTLLVESDFPDGFFDWLDLNG